MSSSDGHSRPKFFIAFPLPRNARTLVRILQTDTVIIIGQQPGSNGPRLRRRRGATCAPGCGPGFSCGFRCIRRSR